MNFPTDIEDKLGFTEIRSLVSEGCRSQAGKHIVSKLKFSSNYKVVDIWLSADRGVPVLAQFRTNTKLLPKSIFSPILDKAGRKALCTAGE